MVVWYGHPHGIDFVFLLQFLRSRLIIKEGNLSRSAFDVLRPAGCRFLLVTLSIGVFASRVHCALVGQVAQWTAIYLFLVLGPCLIRSQSGFGFWSARPSIGQLEGIGCVADLPPCCLLVSFTEDLQVCFQIGVAALKKLGNQCWCNKLRVGCKFCQWLV